MLKFYKPEINNIAWVKDFMKPEGVTGSDRAFGTFALWKDSFDTFIADYKNIPVIRFGADEYIYYVPLRLPETKEIMENIISSAGRKFSFQSIYEEDLEYIESIFPGKFVFSEERDSFDYIYKTDSLADLPGRKYHSKRNHISKFSKLYNYSYTPLEKGNLDICLKLMDEWASRNESKAEKFEEREAIELALLNFDDFNLLGGYLTVNNNPAAFTIAEIVNDTMVDAHFEKALTEYEGIYSVINQEFAKSIKGKFQYINREEDMGIEGLRKSKLSYSPDILLKKYSASLKEI